MTKFFLDKSHAISATSSILKLLTEELNKNDTEDFEIWIAATHLISVLDKHQEKSFQKYMSEKAGK